MPLRPEGATAAAHIIGYKLLIRLLPKLDLRLSRVATRPLSVAIGAFALEVHRKILTLPVTDVRTLIILCITVETLQWSDFSTPPTTVYISGTRLAAKLR